MIHVREKFELPAAPEEVWDLLSDPGRVAPCITGATLGSLNSNGRYPGTMSVRFGPTVVAFRGQVSLGYDHAARTCTIEGRGADQHRRPASGRECGDRRANAGGLPVRSTR